MKIQYNVLKNHTNLIKMCINVKKKEMNPRTCNLSCSGYTEVTRTFPVEWRPTPTWH